MHTVVELAALLRLTQVCYIQDYIYFELGIG